jgi:hypothetical protein
VLGVGTPTYWANMSGPLKTLFDRFVPAFEFLSEGIPKPVQEGKKAVIVVTSAALWPLNQRPSQSRSAVRAVRTVLRSGGYRIKGTINLPGKPGQSRKVPERANRLGTRLQGSDPYLWLVKVYTIDIAYTICYTGPSTGVRRQCYG